MSRRGHLVWILPQLKREHILLRALRSPACRTVDHRHLEEDMVVHDRGLDRVSRGVSGLHRSTHHARQSVERGGPGATDCVSRPRSQLPGRWNILDAEAHSHLLRRKVQQDQARMVPVDLRRL